VTRPASLPNNLYPNPGSLTLGDALNPGSGDRQE